MVIKIVFLRGKKVEVQGFREDRARNKKSWLLLIECTSEEKLWVAPTHLTTETNFNFWIDYEIIIAYCQDKSSPKDDQDFQYCLTVITKILPVPYLGNLIHVSIQKCLYFLLYISRTFFNIFVENLQLHKIWTSVSSDATEICNWEVHYHTEHGYNYISSYNCTTKDCLIIVAS